MKSIFLLLYLFNSQLHNEKGIDAANSNVKAGQQLTVVLANHASNYRHMDSVLVILDKFDHTGAGVVKKKFYPGASHSFTITGVPEGRYFATIQFLGTHGDRIEKTIRIVKQKKNTLKVKLQACEDFSKDDVLLPAEQVNLLKLSVVSSK